MKIIICNHLYLLYEIWPLFRQSVFLNIFPLPTNYEPPFSEKVFINLLEISLPGALTCIRSLRCISPHTPRTHPAHPTHTTHLINTSHMPTHTSHTHTHHTHIHLTYTHHTPYTHHIPSHDMYVSVYIIMFFFFV